MSVTPSSDDSILRLTSVGHVAIAAWNDAPPTVEYIDRLAAFLRALRKAHPRGVGFINLIIDGRPTFSDGVRKATGKLMRDEPIELGSAQVVLLRGFKGIAVRMFLNSVILLGRPQFPHKIFANLEEALDWIDPLVAAGGPDRATLEQACRKLISAPAPEPIRK